MTRLTIAPLLALLLSAALVATGGASQTVDTAPRGPQEPAQPAPSPTAAVQYQPEPPIAATPLPTPEIMASRVLLPGETVRVMPVAVWRVMARTFPPHLVYWAARTSWCESRWQPSAVGDAGRAHGAFQVWPQFWGAVPEDFAAQAEQAAAIVEEYGTGPWSTAEGCEGWRD